MIDAEHCQMFAAYNAWMNANVFAAAAQLSDAQRKEDRGAFFRSVHSTLNHLLWGDRVWLPRFPGPKNGHEYEVGPIGIDLIDDFAALQAARTAMDADITAWAQAIRDEDLGRDLHWYSVVAKRDMARPLWLCVSQMFNHQTHHRGQVTTLLMQFGIDPGSTDLPWAPLARDGADRIVLGDAYAL